MIQIQPTKAGFPQKEGTQLLIRPLINSTTDTTCNTYWELQTENTEILANGNLSIDEQEYEKWGADNETLENIILEKLNLKR
jgi:hypothetical protein